MQEFSESRRQVVHHKTQESRVQVFYDGGCPICSREVSFYRSLRGADRILWTDLCAQGVLPDSLDREEAFRRIHAIDARGEVVSGAQVFSLIWSSVPRLRLLGVFARLPAVSWALDVLYWVFLKLRRTPRATQSE